MNIFIPAANNLCDPQYAAEKLCTPVATITKLRRVLDPTLSYEEHCSIFPLDLGPIWDLASFSAVKPRAESCAENEKQFADIVEQFSDIFQYGLDRYSFPSLDFSQSFVPAENDQRGCLFHTDDSHESSAFKEHWRSPRSLILLARDDEPGTLCVKSTEGIKWVEIEMSGPPARHEALKKFATVANQLVTCTPEHVFAITDRVLHTGQIVSKSGIRTFARAILSLAD